MIPKIRNIIIFVIIAAAFVLIYIYFIKSAPPEANLVSTPASLPDINGSLPTINTTDDTSVVAEDFLTLLLSVKNIKLNTTIFADPAFISLHDSSIILTPDGTEGRPNPFAQFGNDIAPLSLNIIPPAPVSSDSSNTIPPASEPVI